jgi:hypothetical protein
MDKRFYHLAKIPRDFAAPKDWPWVRTIGHKVQLTQHAVGAELDEVRFHVSTRDLSAKHFGETVRGHLGIEREDDSRTRQRTSGDSSS